MATDGKVPMLGFLAGARKFFALLGFSTNATAISAAYLDDFVRVAPIGRFVEVDVIGRFVDVPPIGRFVKVTR